VDHLGRRDRDGGLHKRYLRDHRGLVVDMESWRAKVVGAFPGALPDRILVSEENLAHWEHDGSYFYPITGRLADERLAARSGTHPIVGFLRRHLAPTWGPLGRVRVLVTLRNQSDWLASRYVQGSKTTLGASQADFERQVRRIVASGDAYLDFAGLVTGLVDVVGPDGVTVLLVEEMQDPAYWRTLSAAVGHRFDPPEAGAAHANKRSSAEGWEVRPFDRRFLLPALFGRQPTPGRPSEWTAAALARPAVLARALLARRGTTIRVTDELREAVRARYRESNQRLAESLGRDLTPLGY
jgi:hypothetical protein